MSPATHAAASAVSKSKPLNDTKAIIEASTGVRRQAPAILPSEDKDTPRSKFIEVYPVYSPLSGITMRVGRTDGEPSYWTDMTVREAEGLIADIRSVLRTIKDAEKADSLPDPDDAPDDKVDPDKPTGSWRSPTTGRTYVPLRWVVRAYDPETDDADKAFKFAAVNNKNDSVVWFGREDLALEITGLLNAR